MRNQNGQTQTDQENPSPKFVVDVQILSQPIAYIWTVYIVMEQDKEPTTLYYRYEHENFEALRKAMISEPQIDEVKVYGTPNCPDNWVRTIESLAQNISQSKLQR